jgi:hypothetical protein
VVVPTVEKLTPDIDDNKDDEDGPPPPPPTLYRLDPSSAGSLPFVRFLTASDGPLNRKDGRLFAAANTAPDRLNPPM